MLTAIVGFILVIGILVTIHEFGHYIVARWCGIRVLKFSVGFGPAILSHTTKNGTVYCIAAIPLGGFVRFLDERELEGDEHYSEDELNTAFNRQPVWQRFAVVAAGPIFNFILAFFVFVFIGMHGVYERKPIIGNVGETAQAIGFQPNDELVSIDGAVTATWEDVQYSLSRRIGDSGAIEFEVLRNEIVYEFQYPITNWLGSVKDPYPSGELGLFSRLKSQVASLEGSASCEAGFIVGDKIAQINGESVEYWHEIAPLIEASIEQPVSFTILRDGELLDLLVTPDNVGGVGKIGVRPMALSDEPDFVKYTGFDAVSYSIERIYRSTDVLLRIAQRMLLGKVSTENLSGPLVISKFAGQAIETSWLYFFTLLALLSVTLGVLNLLPIPVLDGGHLVYLLAEGVSGRPVSEKIQEFFARLGVALLLVLMLTAVFNDIGRISEVNEKVSLCSN